MKLTIVEIPVEWEVKDDVKKLKVPNAEVDFGETVTWKWKGGGNDPFYILFPDASPFQVREFQSKENGEASQAIVYNPGTTGARRFKYIIAGFDKKSSLLHILDPDLILPRPGRLG
jgi:hypothetical protein